MGRKRLICEPQAGAKDNLNLNYHTASGGHPWIKHWAQLHTPSHTKLQLASVSLTANCSFWDLLIFSCMYCRVNLGGWVGEKDMHGEEGRLWLPWHF